MVGIGTLDAEGRSTTCHARQGVRLSGINPAANMVGSGMWEGRRVTVIGLGRSGIAAARLLCRMGCRVRVTEAKHTAALQTMREALWAQGVEAVELGGHTSAFIEETELVVVSPGVPESTGPMQWAMERGVPIISEIELAFQSCRGPIVAVTGTNGKSTVVTLIAEVLRSSGRPAVACGNLGIPFSSILDRLTPQTTAVVEVSSFQLLWCRQFRPMIGVLLNVGNNHLDRHRDKRAYLAAKARLFQRQTGQDWAVLNGLDADIVAWSRSCASRCVWFGENHSNPPALTLDPETLRSLTLSAQAVLQVARLLGIPDPLAWQVIRSFKGLEHRLEHVATVRGVHFVNDSKSTTPESLLYALTQTPREVVVIAGGRDKGMDFAPLVGPLHDQRVRGIVLMGESRSTLRALLNGAARPIVQEHETLEAAVQAAARLAMPGTTVLFSPPCASFDMFRDFEDRGKAFKAAVRRMEAE